MRIVRSTWLVMGIVAVSAVLAACGGSKAADGGPGTPDAQSDAPSPPDSDVSDAGKPCKIGSLECGADAVCLGEACEGEGTCVALDWACTWHSGSPGGVCGCDGMTYESACDAYRVGISVSATITGCKEPAGRFTCGQRYCDPSQHYCCRPGGEAFGACLMLNDEKCRQQPPDCACVFNGRQCRVISIDGGTPGLQMSCPSN